MVLRTLFLVLAIAACGEDELVDPDQLPEHTPTLTSAGVTVLVKLSRLRSVGTDGMESTTVQGEATFFDPAADYELLPYTIGECLSDTSKREAVRDGGINENVGTEVLLVPIGGVGTEWPLDFRTTSVRYSTTWNSEDSSPWVPASWYDLVSRDPDRGLSIRKAVTVPTGDLTMSSPAAGASVALDQDLPVVWTPADESALAFVQVTSGGSAVMCVSADDGSFTLPAAQLAALPVGTGNPSVSVHRYFSWRLERDPEVVHLLVEETEAHYVIRQ